MNQDRILHNTKDMIEIRWIAAVCAVALFSLPVFQAFRGLDMTDTGFLATNQQLFFSSPESVSYWFHLWLTNLLGALVYLVFGHWGLLPMKVAAAVIFWITSWGVFSLYGSRKSSLVWIGLVLSIVFSFDQKINVIHYNNLSTLFFVWGIVFLVRGILERRPLHFTAAGAFLALNVFVRLPNIIGLGLLLLVPLADLFTCEPDSKYRVPWNAYFYYGLGIVIAVSAVFLAMAGLGHFRLYWKSLLELGVETGKSGGRYGLLEVLIRPLKATLQALLVGGVSLAGVLCLSYGMKKLGHAAARFLVYAFIAVGTGLLVLQPIPPKFYHLAVAGMVYWAALAAVFTPFFHFDRRVRLALILSAAAILFLSAGSDTIISVSTYAFGAALPALLIWFSHIEAEGLRLSGRKTLLFQGACATVITVVLVYSAISLWTGVYRDTYKLGVTTKVPMLAHIATSPERAKELDDLVPRIQGLTSEGSEVLMADSLGLLHFATKTLPYLGNPWPVLWTEPEITARLEARAQRGLLPVVVLARNNPRYGWPVSTRPPDRMEPFRGFVQDREYELVWRSEATEIWMPPAGGFEGRQK